MNGSRRHSKTEERRETPRTREESKSQGTGVEGFRHRAVPDHGRVGRTISTYRPKSYVFRQGTKCNAVFYIQHGHIELSVVSSQGKERVVGLLGPGSFVGEGCLGGQPLYLASARASTDATIVRVEAETMIQAMHDHPEISERFMAYLLLRKQPDRIGPGRPAVHFEREAAGALLIMLAPVGQGGAAYRHDSDQPGVDGGAVGTTRCAQHFMNKFASSA